MSSNRAVPQVYRSVIDNVLAAVKIDFEEMGMDDTVLQALQEEWESRLAQSGTADYSQDPRMAVHARNAPALPQQTMPSNPSSTAPPETESKPKIKPVPKAEEDDNVLGSDLDESDEEALDGDAIEEGPDGGDLVIALYDKVTRVKNKWKVTLKDGVININGKDYLFSKCAGEFEW